VLPVAVTHNLKAILVLGALYVGVELAGCGSAVQAKPPNSRPPAVSVSLSPTVVSMQVSKTQEFSAAVQNDTQNNGVTWSLTQSGNTCAPGCGSLAATTTAAATYDAPASVPNAAIVTLTATSVADNTKLASLAIDITAPTDVFAAIVKFCDDETENPNCASKGTFSLAQIRDLFIWINWQGLPTGTHTQELDIFMPQGQVLYVKYSNGFQITDTPKGSATVMCVMPVAGSWITQRQFAGTWKVDVLLDGKPIRSMQFDFTP
jgi:hypothetical protein